MHFADLGLARRLERAEAHSNVDFVEARAQVSPETGASWVEVAGTRAMFDGASSPLTQTFGLGILQPVTNSHCSTHVLHYAAEHGCDIAMMCALPGSASQRHAER